MDIGSLGSSGSESSIRKLAHDIPEIRARAIRSVRSKLVPYLSGSVAEVTIDLVQLVKSLLRWFALKPLLQEDVAIDLISGVLQSPGGDLVVNTIGDKSLLKELSKIQQSVGSHLKERIEPIKQFLTQRRAFDKNTRSSKEDLSETRVSSLGSECLDSAIELNPRLTYVKQWQRIEPADKKSLRLLSASLRCATDTANVLHGLQFLKSACDDLPGEYFLQPPYIALNLQSLLVHGGPYIEVLIRQCKHVACCLRKRLLQRRMAQTKKPKEVVLVEDHEADTVQISVASFAQEMFHTALDHFKKLVDDRKLNEINSTYELLHALMDVLLENDEQTSEQIFHFADNIAELAYLVQYFRQTWLASAGNDSQFPRNIYVMLLHLMLRVMDIDVIYANSSRMDELQLVQPIVLDELQVAIYDFPLQHYFEDLWNNVLLYIQEVNPNASTILECASVLRPVIKQLRTNTIDVSAGDPLLENALQAASMMSLVQSVPLAKRIFEQVLTAAAQFANSVGLRGNGEQIILRLLATDHLPTKTLIYGLCVNRMKSFFGSLLDGSAMPTRRLGGMSVCGTNQWLGIPLTTDIITEVICFGAFGTDPQVQSNATSMLSLLIRSKTLLPTSAWSEVIHMLKPTFPLLQCVSANFNQLSAEVLALFNPDNTTLAFLDLFHGNIRLLFYNNTTVRDEALARLLYVLVSRPDAARFMPNVANITDVISSDICIIENPWDAESVATPSAIYDKTSTSSLIELLNTAGTEPEMRKVMLMQLNIVAAEKSSCELIERLNGLKQAINALRNALLDSHSTDYPDAAIPAVGLISKLCVHSANVRCELNADVEVAMMLLRALLLFHKNDSLRRDCAVALFLIAFADFTVGQTTLYLPAVIDVQYRVPFVNTRHWKDSPFLKKSMLENLLLERDATSSEWQYVRFVVARELTPEGLMVKSQTILENSVLSFNANLRLNSSDIRLLRSSDAMQCFRQTAMSLTNSTTHSDVLEALATLKGITSMPINPGCLQDIHQPEIVDCFRRFLCVAPNTDSDQQVFEGTLEVVWEIIHIGVPELHVWTLEQLRRPKNPILATLRSNGSSVRLFDGAARFIRMVLHKAMTDDDPPVRALLAEKLGSSENTLVFYFDAVVGILDDKFERREFEKIRSLLSLLVSITKTYRPNDSHKSVELVCDADAVNYVANKLLLFVVSLKSMSQTGSAFNRNCLRVVANLMHSVPSGRFALSKKYIVLCAGLCGHAGVEVRLAAWSVLTELARSFEGAQNLVAVLSILPGGFHACCLSTFLDLHESSAVRQTAGTLFALLLSHNDANRSIEPNCDSPRSPQSIKIKSTTRDLLNCHQFFTVLTDQLRHFWISDEEVDISLDPDGSVRPTFDVIRTFCSIVAQLLRLLPNEIVSDLQTHNLIIELFRLIITISMARNESTIRLLVEVCKVVALSSKIHGELLDTIALEEHAIIDVMVASTKSLCSDSCSLDLRLEALIGLLNVLTPLALRTNVIQYNEAKTQIHNLASFFNFALKPHQNEDLIRLALNLLRNMLKYVPERSCHITFCQLIETCSEDDSCFDEPPLVSAQIFQLLHGLLQWSGKKNSSLRPAIAATIAKILQQSEGARKAAHRANLFIEILDEFEKIHARLDGVTCAEFLRRFGDAKKEPIITGFRLLYSIVLHWFSRECLVGDVEANDTSSSGFSSVSIQRFCRISMRTWPWAGADQRLQIDFIRSLVFASEDSVPMCKAMSTIRTGTTSSSTLLQMCSEFALAETSRAKSPTANLQLLELSMNIVSNCCACVEGRQFLWKINFLDSMSRLHPSVTKHQKPWPQITIIWLNFYEILSRYPDPNTGIKHLSLLCTFILKPVAKRGAEKRIRSLAIIRNFSFNPVCRPAMMASDEVMYTFKTVIENGVPNEQLIIVTTIWRLVANSYKAKHVFRCGTLLDALWSASRRLAQDAPHDDDAISDLAYGLEMLRLIFGR